MTVVATICSILTAYNRIIEKAYIEYIHSSFCCKYNPSTQHRHYKEPKKVMSRFLYLNHMSGNGYIFLLYYSIAVAINTNVFISINYYMLKYSVLFQGHLRERSSGLSSMGHVACFGSGGGLQCCSVLLLYHHPVCSKGHISYCSQPYTLHCRLLHTHHGYRTLPVQGMDSQSV